MLNDFLTTLYYLLETLMNFEHFDEEFRTFRKVKMRDQLFSLYKNYIARIYMALHLEEDIQAIIKSYRGKILLFADACSTNKKERKEWFNDNRSHILSTNNEFNHNFFPIQ